MSYPIEKAVHGAWKLSNKAAWTGLRLTRMDGLMSGILSQVVPSKYETYWADVQAKSRREREEHIVRDLGKVTAHAFQGKIPIHYKELDPAWKQVKQGESGVRFEDVHDPHTAILLHNITPQPDDRASTEGAKQL